MKFLCKLKISLSKQLRVSWLNKIINYYKSSYIYLWFLRIKNKISLYIFYIGKSFYNLAYAHKLVLAYTKTHFFLIRNSFYFYFLVLLL